MTDREIIARWAGHTVTRLLDDPTLGIVPWIRTDGYDRAYMPDVGIDEWHGNGGLLKKIEEEGSVTHWARSRHSADCTEDKSVHNRRQGCLQEGR